MKIWKRLDEGLLYWSDDVMNWVEKEQATDYELINFSYLDDLKADGVESLKR